MPSSTSSSLVVLILHSKKKKCKQQKEKCVWHEVYILFLFYITKCLFFSVMINQLSRSGDMELFFLLSSLRRNAKYYEEKSYYCQIYHCLKVKTSFHKKLFQKVKKYIIVMDLCLVTFRSFVLQWSAKIAGHQPQLKPLPCTHLKPFPIYLFHLKCDCVGQLHKY